MVVQSRRTILIVDAADEDRRVYCRYLSCDERYSYQIVEAASVGGALAACDAQAAEGDRTLPDLILLDDTLPDGDGLTFLQKWQARYGKPAPVVMMTRQGNEQIAVEARKQGAQDYLVKGSLTAQQLCSSVHTVLERLELQDQLETRHKQLELLAAVAQQIRQSLDLDIVLQTAVQEALPLLQADRVVIYQVREDGTGTVIQESVLPNYPSLLGKSFPEEVFSQEPPQFYREGKVRTIEDANAGGLSPCLTGFVQQFGVQAKLIVPILQSDQGNDFLWGLLIVHQCHSPRHWQDWEVELMQHLATQIAIAIQQTELSERTQAELQEKQRVAAEFQVLVENAPDIIFRMDTQLRYLYFNPAVEALTAQPASSLIGKTAADLGVCEEIGALWQALTSRITHTQREETIEHPFPNLDSPTWFQTRVVPELDETGEVRSFLCIARDISERKRFDAERKQTEQAFQESQILLQLVMDSLPLAIFWKDHQGNFLGCNQQLVVDAGLSSLEEIVGKTDFDMPWREEALLYQADDRLVMESGQPKLNIEEPITKNSNRQGWLRTNKLPLRAADGNIMGVLASYEDITEHKQIEQALQESERRFATLAAAAPVGIYRTDANGTCLYVNDRWCQMTGLTPEAAVGVGWIQGVHPEDRDRVSEAWHRCAHSNELFCLEYRLQKTNGIAIWVFGQAVQEKDAEGTVIGYVGTITDISDRKQAEAALQSLVESTASVTGQDFFSTLAQQLMLALEVEYVMLNQLVGDQLQTLAYWKDGQPQPGTTHALAENPGCAAAIGHGKFYCPEGFRQHFFECSRVQSLQVESYLGMALMSASGQPIGVLCIMDSNPLKDAQWAEALLRIFTLRAAAELERQQATEALEKLNQELEVRVEQRTAALRISEASLSTIFNQAAVGIDLATLDGQYLKVNQKLCDILGYSQEALLGKNVKEVSHPEDVNTGEAEREQLYAGAIDFFAIEKRCLHRDGSTVWISLTVSIIRKLSGEPDYAIGIVEDISDRKRAEDERTQAEEALRQSEEKFRQLAEHIQSVFWISNNDCGEILYLSPAYERIWGRSCASLYASSQIFVDAIHPEDKPRVSEFLTKQSEGYDEEYRILQPDGTMRWIHDRAFPIRNAEGSIYRIVGIAEDITTRKQAEETLNRQLAAIEASIDGIAIVSTDGKFIYINDAHVQLFGYDYAEELLGQPWQVLYSPAEVARLEAEIFSKLMETRAWQGDAIAVRKDGKTFDQEVSLTLTSNGEIICICRDISERVKLETKRQQAELALRESQARFQAFMNHSPAPAWITDANGVLVYASETYYKTIQVPTDNLVGKSIFDVYSPETAQHYLATIQAVAETHQVVEALESAPRLDGTLGDFWVYKFPIPDSSGQTLVGGMAVEVTQQRQVEEALRRSEATKQAIIEAIPDLLMRMSAEGIYLDFISNNRFKVINPKQLRQNANLHDILPHELAQLRMHHVKQALQSGMTQIYEHEIFVEGSQRYEEVRIAPLGRDEVLVMVRDVTARKQAESQLHQTNQELARATRLKDEFLANMSHELRTPLNAILGISEALQEGMGGTLNPRQQKMLSIVEKSGRHLLELINDILDLAKVESGNLELDPMEVPIRVLCEASLTFVKQSAFKKQIQLSSQLPNRVETMRVDERRMRQVLINLLNNAVKFTPTGGQIWLEAHITAPGESLKDQTGKSFTCADPVLCISVRDTGIGISSEHQEQLFKPFVQIDSRLNRQYEGTGLGLALSQRIVNIHGGWIALDSELGQGSCFTICLPQSEQSIPQETMPQVAQSPDESSHSVTWALSQESRSPRILLAEDNEANRETLLIYLENDGYQILLAQDGYEAVAIAHAQSPDLILMDIQMPGMDGLEAIRQIRQNPALVDVPIIALTAFAMPEDRENCFRAGATEYFSKPVQLKALAATLQALL